MHPSGFRRLRPGAVLALAVFVVLHAGTLPARAVPRSVHPVFTRPIHPERPLDQRLLSRDGTGNPVVTMLLEGTVAPELLRAKGIEVGTVAGGRLTAHCPIDRLNALLETPGIDRVEISSRCEPTLDESAIELGLPSVRTVPPPSFTGQTGAGTIVGVVDGGFDYQHDDFKKADGTTRFLSIWDQTVSGTPPSGFSYGTEWNAAQIGDGSATVTDVIGHGTHVLGIAGGDGSATGNGKPAFRYVGVAPEADLVCVKTTYMTADIIDGVNYIFQRAAALGKKAVVNLSLSTQEGPHDGTHTFDTFINALTGPGKIVVASVGNRQQDALHGQITLSGTTPQSMTLDVPAYTRNQGPGNDYMVFSGWYEGGDQVSLTIVTPGGTTIGPIAMGTESIDNNTADGYINAYNATTTPTNGDHEIYAEIYDDNANKAPATGTWTFTFTPVSLGSTGRVDMYLGTVQLGAVGVRGHFVQGLVVGGVIGSPAAADSVIGVAAHNLKDCWDAADGSSWCFNPVPTVGDIAPFSSQGPLRDGRIKPDLSAPGYGVAAAKSADYSPDIRSVMTDGVHFVQAGTSMSTPQVTGTVALLLAQPTWAGAGPSAMKARLRGTARSDAFTGVVPNVAWGAGKLDAAAALAPLVAVSVVHPLSGEYIPPGKPDSILVLLGGPSTADSIEVDLSLDNGASFTIHLGTLTNVPPGSPRSVGFFVDVSMITPQAKARAVAHTPSGVASVVSSTFLIQAPVAVEGQDASAAPRFALGANVPNPFNPWTTIPFAIEKAGRVTLRIYDVRGALVRTLVDGTMPAGDHKARWDGRSDTGARTASGIYLCELTSGGNRLTRKMSLLQ